jgi:predicted O-linked N-acetylglucosamine transferase (SPINDLY family)
MADAWRTTVGKRDEQAAEEIRRDGIDVLVDLTMHMAGNRLGVFAMRPAPVQMTWLAYPGTTGLAAMDWRLTDGWLDPEGEEREGLYVEGTVRLPGAFWCYDPMTEVEAVDARVGREGGIVFGCLNNFCKVNGETLRDWGEILRRVEGSRLVMLAPRGRCREGILRELGVEDGRVRFVDYVSRGEYLEYYRGIDLCLDTFPYNGHTTSLDALWMGVPVMTRVGESVVSRGGLSQLMALGLGELVARGREEFVEKAVGLAGDVGRLEELRRGLRGRMEGSVLMDGPRFVRGLEGAFREMWGKWCAGR